LARGLFHLAEFREAGQIFSSAAGFARSSDERALLLARAVASFAKINDASAINVTVGRMKAVVGDDPTVELRVLRALADNDKNDNGYKDSAIPLLERIVELAPDDYDVRFSLGHAHSNFSNQPLALLHYSSIPESKRSGAAWNNLGVACDAVDIPADAVLAYRKAEEAGETLAMSNLASKFLEAGFLDEAKAECERALKLDDPHRNVGLTWSRAKVLPDEERNRREATREKARPMSDFYRLMGRGMVRPDIEKLSQFWRAPECPIKVTIDGKNFVGEGKYEERTLGRLLRTFGESLGMPQPLESETHRVTYTGVINGRTVFGHVYRRRDGEVAPATSLLSAAGGDRPSISMVLSDDGQELRVMERSKTLDAKFYSLTHMADEGYDASQSTAT
jgi:tetratricopeptide (TPR) repeat protein